MFESFGISVKEIVLFGLIILSVPYVLLGIRIIRPTHRGLIERFGKYKGFAEPGFHWIIPLVDSMVYVNVTECMVNAQSQEIITSDNLNAVVDAQVYYQVINEENEIKKSQYSVDDFEYQIVNLSRTTLRNIIGNLTLKEANNDRNSINKKLMESLSQEASNWGVKVVRAELKQIDPPADVQETMNGIVKAENKKVAAKDLASAEEIRAEGVKLAAIKEAEGKAKAIELVHKAAHTHFTGNAQLLKKLEVVGETMSENSKFIVDSDIVSNIKNVFKETSNTN
jgi:regulator of protease activity HflC (stomatin/prohibitin superfamily)